MISLLILYRGLLIFNPFLPPPPVASQQPGRPSPADALNSPISIDWRQVNMDSYSLTWQTIIWVPPLMRSFRRPRRSTVPMEMSVEPKSTAPVSTEE
jgi:hypothetical protein